MDKKIRLGIIGIGNMGSGHACRVVDGESPDFVLTAVADINPAREDWAKTFQQTEEMLPMLMLFIGAVGQFLLIKKEAA